MAFFMSFFYLKIDCLEDRKKLSQYLDRIFNPLRISQRVCINSVIIAKKASSACNSKNIELAVLFNISWTSRISAASSGFSFIQRNFCFLN